METATSPCVHCGFCLPTCASYQALGTEMDSPRGRIHAIKAIEQHEIVLDSTLARHFDTCLGCYACVTACPSGVRYDELLERIRPSVNALNHRSSAEIFFRKILFELIPYPNRLRAILRPLKRYSGSRLQQLLRASGFVNALGPYISAMEDLLPADSINESNLHIGGIYRTQGAKRGTVGLALGCVQQVFGDNVNVSSINVLTANGFDVVVPPNQRCCGAVLHHQGELSGAKEHASGLIGAFNSKVLRESMGLEQELDAIVVAAAGCGHTIKKYPEIFADDTDTANPQCHSGALFECPTYDVLEFLHNRGLSEEFVRLLKPLTLRSNNIYKGAEFRIAYHDACHMQHGQGITNAPRSLINNIPCVKVISPSDTNTCCGSAGIYNLINPIEASILGESKTKDLTASKPDLIASANIGCTLQIGSNLRRLDLSDTPVLHPIEILDWSYSGKRLLISRHYSGQTIKSCL